METQRGHMLWFNIEKGHGFIATNDGERLYVAASGLADTLPDGSRAGLAVEFEIFDGPEGRHAAGMRFVSDVSPRRARLRRSR